MTAEVCFENFDRPLRGHDDQGAYDAFRQTAKQLPDFVLRISNLRNQFSLSHHQISCYSLQKPEGKVSTLVG
jgi:hypothetical protein